MKDDYENSEKTQKILFNENEENFEQMETDKTQNNFTIKEKLIYILKGISSIISSIIQFFNYYSIWTLGYSVIYLVSFRKNYNSKITHSYAYCYISLMNLSFRLTTPIGGYIEEKMGGKKTIVLSNFILCISFIIIYCSRSIYIDFFLMCLIGFGIGIGYNVTKKNACSFFMNRKSLICAIINFFPNILCFILIFYYEVFILNYDNIYPKIDKIFYEEKIFMNYQKVIIFQIKIIIFTGLGTFLLFFKNNSNEALKFGFNEKIEDNIKEVNNNNEIEKSKKKITKKIKIQKALSDNRTVKLIIMVSLFFPMINLINNDLLMDLHFYFIFGGLYNLVACISSLIFGLIGDIVQFRTLFTIISVLLACTSFLYTYYFNGEFILFIITILISLIFNGFNIIFDSHIMKVYGMENYTEIWGIIRSPEAITEILGIVLNFTLERNSFIYKIIYGITGPLSLVSLGLGLFENEYKFDYNK